MTPTLAGRAGATLARPIVQALAAGAVSALALPPTDLLPALFAYGWLLALLVRAERWPQAWRCAVAFVFAQASVGLHWIAIAFTVDAERFGALAVPAVALLCFGIGLIQGSVVSLLALRRWRSPLAAALLFVPLWLLGEALRGWIGQFPWNLVGYAFAGWPSLAQGAAIGSVWWLGALALLLGVAPVALTVGPKERWRWLGLTACGLVALGLYGTLRLTEETAWTATQLRLVQGAFTLDHGFDPDRLRTWYFRQLALTSSSPAAVDAVIWSEGAAPYFLETDTTARTLIAQALAAAGNVPWLITGGDRAVRAADGGLLGVTNSVFVVGGDAALHARYDKVDLVPFGEFLPFREVLGRVGLDKLAAGSVDYHRGIGRETISLPGLPSFSSLVCYEAIFAGRTYRGPRPEWLLNVTIDTWFGDSFGPQQHLAMARMRAVEEGLPLIRVANSGISAVIDPLGRVHERLEVGARGTIDVTLPSARPPTPFASQRWAVLAATLAALCVGGVLREASAGVSRVNKTDATNDSRAS
ncbi:MAG: apolipoprotein N-acyltransferase [Pseudomonadota bacterium]